MLYKNRLLEVILTCFLMEITASQKDTRNLKMYLNDEGCTFMFTLRRFMIRENN